MYAETEDRLAVSNQTTATAAEEFLERIGDIINTGAQAVMLSIGHRSGLFDVMAGVEPSTSGQIAGSAGLAERYVREWLAVMVTGGIVDYDPERETYHLPADHAACLTRGGALGNLAVYAQHVAMMGALEDQSLHCLETGEGTCYGDYPRFHQIMAEDSEQTVLAALFGDVLPLVGGIEARLESGIDVLDGGCGRGLALLALAERYPRSRFTGYDLGDDAIADAARDADARGLDNVRFETVDMTGFDEAERYDLITSFDAVHDQKHPRRLIDSIHRALKPGGVYLMQDIGGSARLENNLDFPMASLLYAASFVHCTPVSIGQGGDGLGTMWGWETALAMLEQAGFASVERRVLVHDPMNVWFISRKGE
ncbi:MAG: class I SAM-dependent methyltransferase [Gammaproteobacteria bacterium]|jgi:2-polyprenyl-3-methyl-5-hydroxy-6-metoxy-1,4-benzoquinol methylase